VNHDEVARTRGKVNAAQTAIKNAKKQGEESRSNLQKLLNEALSGLPEEERKALSPVWQQVAKRHQINLKK
jgi:outer membrane protein TolC